MLQEHEEIPCSRGAFCVSGYSSNLGMMTLSCTLTTVCGAPLDPCVLVVLRTDLHGVAIHLSQDLLRTLLPGPQILSGQVFAQ